MSSSSTNRRRILRSDDGVVAPTARLLVDVPGGDHSATDVTGGLNQRIEQARSEGFDEGYRTAMDELAAAEAAGRAAQLRRVADAIVDAANQVRDTRREVVTFGAAEAAQLAYDIAESFLQRELAVGRPVLDAVVRALSLVPEGEDLVVRLNPADALTPEEITEMTPDSTVKVIHDPRVEAGGCVVQAGPCRIDTQLGSALQRVRQLLNEAYPGSMAELDPVEEDVA